jgi:hypothetical protein
MKGIRIFRVHLPFWQRAVYRMSLNWRLDDGSKPGP